MSNDNLVVQEMYSSIDGEINYWGQGFPSIFIRLAGCNLNCPYCDTKYAKDTDGAKAFAPEELKKSILKIFPGYKKITITGGEPLLQATALYNFIKLLEDEYLISIETNGIETSYGKKS